MANCPYSDVCFQFISVKMVNIGHDYQNLSTQFSPPKSREHRGRGAVEPRY